MLPGGQGVVPMCKVVCPWISCWAWDIFWGSGSVSYVEGSVSLAPRRFPGCQIVFLGAREGFLATRNNFFGIREGYMGARKHFIGEK